MARSYGAVRLCRRIFFRLHIAACGGWSASPFRGGSSDNGYTTPIFAWYIRRCRRRHFGGSSCRAVQAFGFPDVHRSCRARHLSIDMNQCPSRALGHKLPCPRNRRVGLTLRRGRTLMHGVAPQLCGQVARLLLGGGVGGRSPDFLSSSCGTHRCTLKLSLTDWRYRV